MENRNKDGSQVPGLISELRFELARKMSRNLRTAEKRETAIPGLVLHQRTGPTPPCAVAYAPGLIVMAQGSKRVELGNRAFTYDESSYLLTSLDLPSISQVIKASPARPALALSMKIELSLVREILLRDDVPVQSSPAGNPAMTTGEVTAELLGACCRLIDLLETPKDALFLSGLIQKEIIYRILQRPEGARLRAITTQGEQSHRTAQAIAWLKANYEKPLKVEELAQQARMGVSTFHHHFREMTAMSPVQYQKQLRLQAARSRMLTDDLDASSAAIEVGYESVSQFNREYSRLFGQPPLRDIRAQRATESSLAQSLNR